MQAHQLQLLNLLTDPTHDACWWKFVPQQTRHPTSGAQILFVMVPSIGSTDFDLKPSRDFHTFSVRCKWDKAGVKFGAHIWVHDTSESWLKLDNGIPCDWDNLKKIFEEDVKLEMNNVTFLSIGWKGISLEGQEQKQRIQKALTSDAEKGLAFGQLPLMDKDEAWRVINGIIDLTRASLGGRAGAEDRSKRLSMIADDIWERKREQTEEAKKDEEEGRVRRLQEELDELYAQLNKTEYGRGVRAKFRRADDDKKRIMEPLLAQLNNEALEPEEKEKLEIVIKEEYVLCLREFQGHFAEVRAMRIEVGPTLSKFYGLYQPTSRFQYYKLVVTVWYMEKKERFRGLF
ncbi:hypothetical protein D9756_006914 [Leucocoprinus leucothites]|uniref:Uncharacterized protein n=1 Tax=Leucocoprinus leucothites TaxID=201217 RepID=A0A8H5D783_9AGAR|nr:hypothetical protein D9756_006914 [Leucoagaricus leucothites]